MITPDLSLLSWAFFAKFIFHCGLCLMQWIFGSVAPIKPMMFVVVIIIIDVCARFSSIAIGWAAWNKSTNLILSFLTNTTRIYRYIRMLNCYYHYYYYQNLFIHVLLRVWLSFITHQFDAAEATPATAMALAIAATEKKEQIKTEKKVIKI